MALRSARFGNRYKAPTRCLRISGVRLSAQAGSCSERHTQILPCAIVHGRLMGLGESVKGNEVTSIQEDQDQNAAGWTRSSPLLPQETGSSHLHSRED